MARQSSWAAYLKGRDPNEPVEPPAVILLGCRPFTPAESRPMNADCPVCKGRIREVDTGYYCGCSDHAAPAVEANLAVARRLTPPPRRDPKPSARPAGKTTRRQRRKAAKGRS